MTVKGTMLDGETIFNIITKVNKVKKFFYKIVV